MRIKSIAVLGAVIAGCAYGVVVAQPAFADQLRWIAGGADNNWSTGANWSSGAAPNAGDSITFGSGNRMQPVNDLPPGLQLSDLAFDGNGYTVSGNSLAINHSLVQSGSGPQTNTVTMPLSFAGLGEIDNLNTSDGSVLNLNGPLKLADTQTYARSGGDIVINGVMSNGELEVNSPNVPGVAPAGRVIVNSASTSAAGVRQGTLTVDGTMGSVIVTSTGAEATLTGAGTVDGAFIGAPSPVGDTRQTGTVRPGDPGGVLRAGSLAVDDAGTVEIPLGGPSASQQGSLQVSGSISVRGGLALDLGFKPAVGQSFTIINNTSSQPVFGTFDGLPEGASFVEGDTLFRITYAGGDGNDVVIKAVNPPATSIVTGPGSGGGPNVRTFGGRSLSFSAGTGGSGGATVATGNVTGGQLDDIVVGSGPGVPSRVMVYRSDGSYTGTSFSPYGDGFTGGVNVGVADVDGDGVDEIVTGAGAGGGPNVKVFRGNGAPLASFFAYDPAFHGGVRVAGGDVGGSGVDQIITGPGPGGGPNVAVFSPTGARTLSFFAYDPGFVGGVYVAGADVDGDGTTEIVTGAGPGGGPHVRVFSGTTPIGGFFAYDPGFVGGVKVGAVPDFVAQRDDIVTGAGPGGGPNVKVFTPTGGVITSFFAYDAGFYGGVNVAGAILNQPQ